MKKGLLFVFIFVFSFAVTSAASQEFLNKFHQTVEFNKQFPNPNLVYPGDTVFVPIVIQEKNVVGPGHDCIYKAVKRSDIAIIPTLIKTDSISATSPKPINATKSPTSDNWWKWLLAFAIAGLIAALILAILRRQTTVFLVEAPEGQQPQTPTPAPVPNNINIRVAINGRNASVQTSGNGNINIEIDVNENNPSPTDTNQAN